jgi:plasmid stability protein
MATITVKNIPDDLYERLKQRAEANRRSLNSEIIRCIEQSVLSRPIDAEAFLARAHELRELTSNYLITDEELEVAKRSGRP